MAKSKECGCDMKGYGKEKGKKEIEMKAPKKGVAVMVAVAMPKKKGKK
jgi:hypothetical protein